jgi:hypothetical protein
VSAISGLLLVPVRLTTVQPQAISSVIAGLDRQSILLRKKNVAGRTWSIRTRVYPSSAPQVRKSSPRVTL